MYIPNYPSSAFHYSEANKYGMRSPKDQGLPYKEVHIITDDHVKLHGWLIT